MPLQNFLDKSQPAISAAWLNGVDILATSIFGTSTTKVQARANLTSDLPLEIANGGTASRTAAAARIALTTDAPLEVANGGTGQRTLNALAASFSASPMSVASLASAGAVAGTAFTGNSFAASATVSGATGTFVTLGAVVGTTGTFSSALVAPLNTALYSSSMNINAVSGNTISITPANAVAFTINNPTGSIQGQRLVFLIRNTVGMGPITWPGLFKMSTWTNPATGFSRAIELQYDGTNWIQLWQATVDVPN